VVSFFVAEPHPLDQFLLGVIQLNLDKENSAFFDRNCWKDKKGQRKRP
jgi:hypothetical protein